MIKSFRFRQPEFRDMQKSPTGIVGRDLRRRALLVEAAAKAKVGVKTGALKKSIGHTMTVEPYGQKAKVGSSLNYALPHHEGTKPHVILPKKAKALKFTVKGRTIITKRVNHPGTKPNKFLSSVLYLAKRGPKI